MSAASNEDSDYNQVGGGVHIGDGANSNLAIWAQGVEIDFQMLEATTSMLSSNRGRGKFIIDFLPPPLDLLETFSADLGGGPPAPLTLK